MLRKAQIHIYCCKSPSAGDFFVSNFLLTNEIVELIIKITIIG